MADTAGEKPVVNSMNRCAYVIAGLLLNLLAPGGSFLFAGDSASTLIKPKDAPELIFSADFEHADLGLYTNEQLKKDWNNPSWSDGIEEERVWVVETKMATRRLDCLKMA